MASSSVPLKPRLLIAYLYAREEEEAKRAYNAELMWQFYRITYNHYGYKNFSFPQYSEIFKHRNEPKPAEREDESIRNEVMGKMKRIAEAVKEK